MGMDYKDMDLILKTEMGLDLFTKYQFNLNGRRSLCALDPVVWAREQLGWEARWYQAQFLRDTTSRVVLRWGRRTGKSEVVAIKALDAAIHEVETHRRDPGMIAIITPYENQLTTVFEKLRNFLAYSMPSFVVRDITDPQRIELKNGSKIYGFSTLKTTGARSEMIRGQDISMAIIDEADLIRDTDMDVVLAVMASHPKMDLILTGTPSGCDTKFKTACTDKVLGFKEFWVASLESPSYNKDTDFFFRRMFSDKEYKHEILACF